MNSLDFKDVRLLALSCYLWWKARLLVYVLVVPAEVARLRKSLAAHVADERSTSGVLSEVVTQVAAFAELLATTLILASKEKLDSVGLTVSNFDCFMPLHRDTLEFLWCNHNLVFEARSCRRLISLAVFDRLFAQLPQIAQLNLLLVQICIKVSSDWL